MDMSTKKKWYVEIKDIKIYSVIVEASSRREAKEAAPEALRQGKGKLVGYETEITATKHYESTLKVGAIREEG